MSFSLHYHDERIKHAVDVLGVEAPKAIARALNRGATTARATMQRRVAVDMKLKVGAVREEIKVDQARPFADRLRARVWVTGNRIPLIDFGARQTKRGVSADTGQGRKVYPHTFIAKMRSGHVGVFQRKTIGRGSKRLPIIERFGPSLPLVFSKHAQEGLVAGEASIAKNLEHELGYALQQASST